MESSSFIKYAKHFGLLLAFYYYIYPQAIAVGNNSMLIPMAALGLGIYLLHGYPFREVFKVLAAFSILIFWFYTAPFINEFWREDFHIMYTRTQMGFLFASYLVTFLFFSLHKKPTFNTFVLYIVGAVTLQSIVTFLMYKFPDVNEFFLSIQVGNALEDVDRNRFQSERLVGNGTGLFGAGVTSGAALIMYAYVLISRKYTTFQLILLTIGFAITFFIGLFMARTTVIGLAGAVVYLIVFFITNKDSSNKRQFLKFMGLCFVFFSLGTSFAYVYMPQFTDWGFELFINFQRTGELTTSSSEDLLGMFIIPDDAKTFWLGNGSLFFMGYDVGYTRLWYYSGIIGTVLFFAYQAYIISLSMTKDHAANLMIVFIFGHCLISNIKGIIDENYYLYLFFFFFIYYKYYVYYPRTYRITLSHSLKK